MATALLSAMGQDHFASRCIDPSELDSFVDFGTQNSPSSATSDSVSKNQVRDGRHLSMASMEDDLLSLDQPEDLQRPAKPSHEYNLYKQQTGIPLKSVPGLESSCPNTQSLDFPTSGFDESSYMPDSSYDGLGSMSGLGLCDDVNMDVDFAPNSALPAFFFPPAGGSSQSLSFMNPSALGDRSELHTHVRVWPGMHQQQAHQAALAKAQEQSRQAETRSSQKQPVSELHCLTSQHGKRSSHASLTSKRRVSSNTTTTDAQTEAVINRVVNQIVRNQNSALASGDVDSHQASSSSSVSNFGRLRKDDEEMDDDEKLLASEEGKKLSSKERRQLRNKVSARAFRSRRKQYISQLESEVASKVNEANELRVQNEALMEENARSREFIERLLRHPAFHPFLDDLSRDPAIVEAASQKKLSSKPSDEQSLGQRSKAASQIQDISSHDEGSSRTSSEVKVPLRGNPWPVPDMDIGTFESPRVYAVLDLPHIQRLLPEEHNFFDKDGSLSVPPTFESDKTGFAMMDASCMDLSGKISSPTNIGETGYSFDLFDDKLSITDKFGQCRHSAPRMSKLSDKASMSYGSHLTNDIPNVPSFDRLRQICIRIDPYTGKPIGKWSLVESTSRFLFPINQVASRCTARHQRLHSQSDQRASADSSGSTNRGKSLSRLHALTDGAIDHVKKSLQLLRVRHQLQGSGEDFSVDAIKALKNVVELLRRSTLTRHNDSTFLGLMKSHFVYSGMPSFLQFITTPTVDCPGTLMMLQFGKQRYLIGNFVEGTERIRTELNVSRKTVEDIFITGSARWNNLIGLVSTLMTIAERKAVAVELPNRKNYHPRLSTLEEHPKSMQLFGPPHLSHFLATLRRFVMKRYLPLEITEVREDDHTEIQKEDPQPVWKDQYLEAWAMAISPRKNGLEHKQRRHNFCEGDVSGSLKRKHDEIERSQDATSISKDSTDHRTGLAKVIARNMFNSDWKPNAYQEVHISEVEMPAKIFVQNSVTNVIEPYEGPYPGGEWSLPDIKVLVRKQWPTTDSKKIPYPLPSDDAISYIIKSRNQRGKFQVDVADKLGLQKFERGLLVRGHNVITKDGKKVTPDMVLGDSIQGGGVAIIDLPNADYVEPLMSRSELKDAKLMKGVGAFIWILGSGVSTDVRLKKFIRDMPWYEHIVSSTDCCPNRLIMGSVSAATAKYSQMDPQRFRVPHFHNTEVPQRSVFVPDPPKIDACTIDGTVPAQIGLRLQIDPKVSIQDNYVHPPLDLQKVLEVLPGEASELGKKARKVIEEDEEAIRSWRECIPSPDTEIITLGTGSAAPAKYRNVSATLIRVPGCGSYLLDCGEGTLGSLQRVFAPDELSEVLKDLRMIWISHQHVDHHLGTIPLIAAWHHETQGPLLNLSSNSERSLFQSSPDLGSSEKRLAIIAEESFINFLKEYAEFENYGLAKTMPIVLHSAHPASKIPTLIRWDDTRIPARDYERLLGFSNIEAVRVEHCRGAKALVLTFPTGFKLAFSGDCRPSEAFARIGQGATVLIHEATFAHGRTKDAQKKRHSTTSEALQIGAAMNAKSVVLTHFSQRYSRLPVMEETIEMGFPYVNFSEMNSSKNSVTTIEDGGTMDDKVAGETVEDEEPADVSTAALPEDGEDGDGHKIEGDDNVMNDWSDDVGDGVGVADSCIVAEEEGKEGKAKVEEQEECNEQEREKEEAELHTKNNYRSMYRENIVSEPSTATDPIPQGCLNHLELSQNLQARKDYQMKKQSYRRTYPHQTKFRHPRGMKVCVAFDYMRIKVKDIVEMEKFTPALERLTEIPSATYGVMPLQTGPLNIQEKDDNDDKGKKG